MKTGSHGFVSRPINNFLTQSSHWPLTPKTLLVHLSPLTSSIPSRACLCVYIIIVWYMFCENGENHPPTHTLVPLLLSPSLSLSPERSWSGHRWRLWVIVAYMAGCTRRGGVGGIDRSKQSSKCFFPLLPSEDSILVLLSFDVTYMMLHVK